MTSQAALDFACFDIDTKHEIRYALIYLQEEYISFRKFDECVSAICSYTPQTMFRRMH